MTTKQQLELAVSARAEIAAASSERKNLALNAMADCLLENEKAVLDSNAADMEESRGKISGVMMDRLRLTPERIAAMAKGMRDVALLPDPVGETISETVRPNGLKIRKVRVPMGVIAIIYESRPNVTSDAAALAIKAGSACVLRSGRQAHKTAKSIAQALRSGLERAGLPADAVQLIEDTDHASAQEMMTAVGYIDLLIPRGGAGLIKSCVENATVPVIETGTGICHIYVDETADREMALDIVENAKMSRPSVCNAEEVLLVNSAIAESFLPALYDRLVAKRISDGRTPAELRLDERALAIIPGKKAGDRDFDTEFLDYILAVKVVGGVDEAIEHIARHSTHHSEAIITKSAENAARFAAGVDSAAVYINASTRFTDGGEFGLGCEMGISTQKLHARGPMGLEELCTYKYIISGNGQIR